MSAFLTHLVVELVDDADPARDGRTTWRLTNPLIYQSDVGGTIVVPRGFVTDFASVPRLPVTWFVAGGQANEPAVVHDWLYSSHELPRPTADAVFLEAMKLEGQPLWRRVGMWAAVRLFGGTPYNTPDPPTPGSPS